MKIKRGSIPLGAGLWRSRFARIEDGKIVELANKEEALKKND